MATHVQHGAGGGTPPVTPGTASGVSGAVTTPMRTRNRFGRAYDALRGRDMPLVDQPGTQAPSLADVIERKKSSRDPEHALKDFLDQVRTDARDRNAWLWGMITSPEVREGLSEFRGAVQSETEVCKSLDGKLNNVHDPAHLIFTDTELKFLIRLIIGNVEEPPIPSAQHFTTYLLEYGADIASRDEPADRNEKEMRYKEELAFLLRQLSKEGLIDKEYMDLRILPDGRAFGEELAVVVAEHFGADGGEEAARYFRSLLFDSGNHGWIEDLVRAFAAPYDERDVDIPGIQNQLDGVHQALLMGQDIFKIVPAHEQGGVIVPEAIDRSKEDEAKLRAATEGVSLAISMLEEKLGAEKRRILEEKLRSAYKLGPAITGNTLYQELLRKVSQGISFPIETVKRELLDDWQETLTEKLMDQLTNPENKVRREILRAYVKMLGDLRRIVGATEPSGAPEVLERGRIRGTLSWEFPSLLNSTGRKRWKEGLARFAGAVGNHFMRKNIFRIGIPTFRMLGAYAFAMGLTFTPPWWGQYTREAVGHATGWFATSDWTYGIRHPFKLAWFELHHKFGLGHEPRVPGRPRYTEHWVERTEMVSTADGKAKESGKRKVKVLELPAIKLFSPSEVEKAQMRYHIRNRTNAEYVAKNPALADYLRRLPEGALNLKNIDAFIRLLRRQYPEGVNAELFTPPTGFKLKDGTMGDFTMWARENGYLHPLPPPVPPVTGQPGPAAPAGTSSPAAGKPAPAPGAKPKTGQPARSGTRIPTIGVGMPD